MDQIKQQLQFKEVELSQKFQEDLHAKERTILELKQEKELQQILSLTENGTDDIISTRSKIFQKLNIDVESISVTELLSLIEQYPSLFASYYH